MNQPNIQDLLIQNVSNLKGVGVKIKKLLKKKKLKKYLIYCGIFHKVILTDQIYKLWIILKLEKLRLFGLK